MLKSDQSVLRLELEEDKAQPDYVYAALPAYDTHNNEVSVSMYVWDSCQVESFGFPPLNGAQQLFWGRGRGDPHKLTAAPNDAMGEFMF